MSWELSRMGFSLSCRSALHPHGVPNLFVPLQSSSTTPRFDKAQNSFSVLANAFTKSRRVATSLPTPSLSTDQHSHCPQVISDLSTSSHVFRCIDAVLGPIFCSSSGPLWHTEGLPSKSVPERRRSLTTSLARPTDRSPPARGPWNVLDIAALRTASKSFLGWRPRLK